MKKLLFLLLFAIPVFAAPKEPLPQAFQGVRLIPQIIVGVGTAQRFQSTPVDLTKCAPGDVEFNTTSGTFKACQPANTWTAFSVGGATIGGSIANTQVAFGTGVNTIGGSNNLIWNSSSNQLQVGVGPDIAPGPGNSLVALSEDLVDSNAQAISGTIEIGATGSGGNAAAFLSLDTGSNNIQGLTTIQTDAEHQSSGTISNMVGGIEASTLVDMGAGAATSINHFLVDSPIYNNTVGFVSGLEIEDLCGVGGGTVAASSCDAIHIQSQTAPGKGVVVDSGGIFTGVDNSHAGSLQIANGSAAAHTIFSSAATTSNTYAFPATVLTTNTFGKCVTASTTCTITQSLLTDNATALSYSGSGGAHITGVVGIGTTPTDALQMFNTTAAAAGAQQFSPSVHWQGQGWKTNSVAASEPVDFISYVVPVQGTTVPSASWFLKGQSNNAGFNNVLSCNYLGDCIVYDSLQTPAIYSGATGNIIMSTTAPSILAAGCGGSGASISTNNGTAAFKVNVGTSNTGPCTVTMPAAATDWVCFASDNTTRSANVFITLVKPGGTPATQISLQNYTTAAATHAWTDSDVIQVTCNGE